MGAKMPKLVKCKACSADISKSAKKCPNCGHKNKGGIGGILLWGFVGVVGLVIVAGVVGGSSDTATYASEGKGDPVAVTHAIGDIVKSGDFSVAVTGVRPVKTVGSMYIAETAAPGAAYIVVTYSYRNDSDAPKGAFSVPTILLEDSNGTAYKKDIGATSSFTTEANLNAKGFSDVNPGIQIDDAAVFEVSESLWHGGEWKVLIDNGRHDFRVAAK